MTIQQAIEVAYLVVSCVALVVQSWALGHLQATREQLVRTGLHRTALCRVAGAVAYVGVGVNALWINWSVPVATFAVFALIQIMYMLNARADVRLKHRLTNPGRS